MAPRLKLYLHCGYRSLVLVVLVRVRGEEGRKGRVKWRRKRVRKKAFWIEVGEMEGYIMNLKVRQQAGRRQK